MAEVRMQPSSASRVCKKIVLLLVLAALLPSSRHGVYGATTSTTAAHVATSTNTSTSATTTSTAAAAAATTSTTAATTIIQTNSTVLITTTTPPPAQPPSLGPIVVQPREVVFLHNYSLASSGKTMSFSLSDSPKAPTVTFSAEYDWGNLSLVLRLYNTSMVSSNWNEPIVSDVLEIAFTEKYTGPPFKLDMFVGSTGSRRHSHKTLTHYQIRDLDGIGDPLCNCSDIVKDSQYCEFQQGGQFAIFKTHLRKCPNLEYVPEPRPIVRPFLSRGVLFVDPGEPVTYEHWLNASFLPGFALTFSAGDTPSDPFVVFDRSFVFHEDWWFSLSNTAWDLFQFPDTWDADLIVSDIISFNQSPNPNVSLGTTQQKVTFSFHPIRFPDVAPIREAAVTSEPERRSCATEGYEYRVTSELDSREGSCQCEQLPSCIDEIYCKDFRDGRYALRIQQVTVCSPPEDPPPPPAKNSDTRAATAGGVVAGMVVVCLLGYAAYKYHKYKLKNKKQHDADLLPPPPMLKIHLNRTKKKIPKHHHYVRKPEGEESSWSLSSIFAKLGCQRCFGKKKGDAEEQQGGEEALPDEEAAVLEEGQGGKSAEASGEGGEGGGGEGGGGGGGGTVVIRHFSVTPHQPFPISLAVPVPPSSSSSAVADPSEPSLLPLRSAAHRLFLLPLDRPFLRSPQALSFAASLQGGIQRLQNVHEGLPPSGVKGGTQHVVQGRYEYCHYMQDKFNDDGWGCMYRSYQTVLSWFRLQHYTSKSIQSHEEVQRLLVKMGDKPDRFIGSKQWIGAMEASMLLDEYLGVQCKVMNVASGSDLADKGRELAHHFDTQGTPIPIGGGVLAFTILGVDFNAETGHVKFLILDPHYTGSEDLGTIQNQGKRNGCSGIPSVGWHDATVFRADSFYNLALPQRPTAI
mmetsp:Transcript_71632/g.149474  ORF Transcript_71632/g.149474 Transcript_71632/m.149474 type:complete len:909 (-) Transcript_71632:351-3077(-)